MVNWKDAWNSSEFKAKSENLLLIDSVRLEVLDVAYLDTLGAQFPTFLMRRDWLVVICIVAFDHCKLHALPSS